MGKFSTLEQTSITKDWSLEERSALAHFLDELQVDQHETIFSMKSNERVLFIIESGTAKFAIEGFETDLGPGDSFSEMSLIKSSPKVGAVIATSPCSLWVLKYDKWNDMKKAAPIISLKLLESVCEKMIDLLGQNFQIQKVLPKTLKSGDPASQVKPQTPSGF